MSLCDELKVQLSKTFGFGFNVIDKSEPAHPIFLISAQQSNSSYFQIGVEIKSDLRLIITAEPEKYGADFLNAMNSSTADKRRIFVQYWNNLSADGKITIKINDSSVDPDSFMANNTTWAKFDLRFTKIPYCDENDTPAAKHSKVIDYTILICSMMLSLVDYSVEGATEGTERYTESTYYERNPVNRAICLYVKGYKCACCGFDFEETYGEIGKEFIEVHHITPISSIGHEYKIDPVKDLVPLCPNCHAMIHRRNPPYSVEELKAIMEENKK